MISSFFSCFLNYFFYDLKGETYIADLEKWFKTKALYVFICNVICTYNIIYNAYYHYEYSIIYNMHNIIYTHIYMVSIMYLKTPVIIFKMNNQFLSNHKMFAFLAQASALYDASTTSAALQWSL